MALGDVARARTLYTEAEQLYRQRRYSDAARRYMESYREAEGTADENPTPIWAAAQAYEQAQDWGAAIQHYDRAGREGYAYAGSRRLEWNPESAYQAAARLRRAHPSAVGAPSERPAAEPTTDKGVIEEVWDWVTGGGGDEPGSVSTVGAKTMQQSPEDVSTVVGAAASKMATTTARQTAAVEERPTQQVRMPTGGAPSWLPYVLVGAAGLGVLAIVGYFLTRPEESASAGEEK
jgi:hypothetical protein